MKLNYVTLAIFVVFVVAVGAWVVHQPMTPMRITGIAIALPCALLLNVATFFSMSGFAKCNESTPNSPLSFIRSR